jgi:hypothetical protein
MRKSTQYFRYLPAGGAARNAHASHDCPQSQRSRLRASKRRFAVASGVELDPVRVASAREAVFHELAARPVEDFAGLYCLFGDVKPAKTRHTTDGNDVIPKGLIAIDPKPVPVGATQTHSAFHSRAAMRSPAG